MKKKKSSLLAIASMLLVIVMALGACGGSATPAASPQASPGASPQAPAKDTLTVAMNSNPSTLDGNAKNDSASITVRRQMYNTLVEQDTDMNIIPSIAESWEYENDTTLVFKIRKDVKFHNGEILKASDVKFSLERAFEMGFAANSLSMIDFEKCEAVDDNTYKLVLLYPFAPILSNICAASAAIVHEATVAAMGDNYNVGTGPYKFKNWVQGDRVELERFDDFWGTAPACSNIVFRIITENTNRAIEIETGGVDIALDISPSDVSRLEGNSDIALVRDLNLSTTYIGYNFSKEPLNNVKVRQAISCALDLRSIVDAVYFGAGIPAEGFISPKTWGFSDSTPLLEYNPDRAKELLAEAGYPNGLSTTIWTSDNQTRVDIAEIAQNQLRAVGIEAEVKIVEWASFLVSVENEELDIYILGITASTGDADALYSQFHSTSHFSGNTAHYKNPALDALLDKSRMETDEAKRLAILEEIQTLLAEEVPWMPVWHGENITATRSDVEGFKNYPTGTHYLGNVKFK